MINAQIKDKLRSFCKGNLSHAYLICGAEGIGKKTLAQDMAKTILCETKGGAPCGVCRACSVFDAGGHPDIISLSPGGPTDIIKVEAIRGLIEKCAVKPIMGDRRVVIINRAERMNVNAQNAFLKLLEEPEEGTVFLLLCSNMSLILPTVRSRCVLVNVPPSAKEDIESAVKRYENSSSLVTAAQAASYSEGIIGRAIDLMAADEKHPYFTVLKIMDALCGNDMAALMQCIPLINDKRTLFSVASGMTLFCLDALSCMIGEENCRFPTDKVRASLVKLTKSKALIIIEAARKSMEDAEVSISDIRYLAQKLLLTCCEEVN